LSLFLLLCHVTVASKPLEGPPRPVSAQYDHQRMLSSDGGSGHGIHPKLLSHERILSSDGGGPVVYPKPPSQQMEAVSIPALPGNYAPDFLLHSFLGSLQVHHVGFCHSGITALYLGMVVLSLFVGTWLRGNFKCFLKLLTDNSLWSESGKLFHARGTVTAKTRSPMAERRVLSTTSCKVDGVWLPAGEFLTRAVDLTHL